MPFIAIAVALMVALGGSVAVEHAQPGDSLFSIKTNVNSHMGTSTLGLLKTLHIESDADADAGIEMHGNATSSAAHERNDERMGAQASSTGTFHVGTGTRVKVEADGGADEGTELHNDGTVNTQL